jgi:glycosyltransferase involved in cell wall biosynthesis
MNATVVIKTFLRPHACIASVQSWCLVAPGIPIIVVDDGGGVSPDLTPFSNVRHIKTEFDIGVSAGRNIGVAEAETKYVIVADDDNGCRQWCDLDAVISEIESRDVDLLGVGAYTMSVTDNGRLTIEGKPRVEGFTPCDATLNHFIASKDSMPPWDDRMKCAGEHVDFFLECRKRGVKVAGTPMLDFYRTTRASRFASPEYSRHRRRNFTRLVRQKWNLRSVSRWGVVP